MQGGAEASKVLGQWAVGSALIGSAVMLAQEGRITGGGPRNPQARKAMQDLGWQPYSIKIGDKWYGFNRLDPLASFFGIVGDYFELTQAVGASEEESRSVLESALVMLCAVGKNTTSKTYLQNVTSILSILENPDMSSLGRISSYGAQIAQGFVPSYSHQPRARHRHDRPVHARSLGLHRPPQSPHPRPRRRCPLAVFMAHRRSQSLRQLEPLQLHARKRKHRRPDTRRASFIRCEARRPLQNPERTAPSPTNSTAASASCTARSESEAKRSCSPSKPSCAPRRIEDSRKAKSA